MITDMVISSPWWFMRAWMLLCILHLPALPVHAQTAPASQDATRKVLFEEFTGEWCSLCPGGSIEMERALRAFSDRVVPISYHDNDPMEMSGLNAMLDSIPFDPLYPGGTFDRLPLSINNPKHKMSVDRYDFLSTLEKCVQTPATASIDAQLSIDRMQRRVTITVRTEFFAVEQGDFRIQCVLTENDVQRNDAQLNAYDGDSLSYPQLFGAGNPLRIWSHQYMARAVLGGAAGLAGIIPQNPAVGVPYEHRFEFPYTTAIGNIDKLGVAVFVHRYKNKSLTGNDVLNANGYLGSQITEVPGAPAATRTNWSVYPNPCRGIAYTRNNGDSHTPVSIELFDTMGRRVPQARIVPFDRSTQLDLRTVPSGLYLVRIAHGSIIETHPLLLNP